MKSKSKDPAERYVNYCSVKKFETAAVKLFDSNNITA